MKGEEHREHRQWLQQLWLQMQNSFLSEGIQSAFHAVLSLNTDLVLLSSVRHEKRVSKGGSSPRAAPEAAVGSP